MTRPVFSESMDGPLDQYFREISRYPLIDQDEEARLAKGIRRGEEEALDKLVRSNLRFVVSVSKRYRNRGVPLQDLINEGNLGLIRAARRFDGTRGIRFVTYAVWWIRQAILRALAEQSRIVRVPVNRAGQVRRIDRRKAELAQDLGREPTASEIARALDLSAEEVEQVLAVASSHLSLDAPLFPGNEGSLLDCLPDPISPSPDEVTFERALTESLEAALATLDDREASTLRLYFGLGHRPPMSLEEIGIKMGITRERVRQIKQKALARLRDTSSARILETFAD